MSTLQFETKCRRCGAITLHQWEHREDYNNASPIPPQEKLHHFNRLRDEPTWRPAGGSKSYGQAIRKMQVEGHIGECNCVPGPMLMHDLLRFDLPEIPSTSTLPMDLIRLGKANRNNKY